jgi:hypothetical protein
MSMIEIGFNGLSGLKVSHCIAMEDGWVPEQHYRSAADFDRPLAGMLMRRYS